MEEVPVVATNKKRSKRNGNARNNSKSSQNRKWTKPDRRDDYDDDRKPRGGRQSSEGMNDVSWYTKNPALLVAAGSFPYPYRPGMNVPYGTLTGFNSTTGDASTPNPAKYFMPGVTVINWVPTFGHSSVATDPASIAGKEIYSRVRKAYSGQLDADAPDFIIYLACLDSIFSYLAWLKRMYRVLDVWTPENYVLPDRLLSSMGLPSAGILNLRQNKMQFWQVINELILMSRKFTCPALMDIMNRHYWMSDNVYADDSMLNSQFYMFNPDGFYIFGELDDPNGTSIKVPGAQFCGIYTSVLSTTSGQTVDPERFYTFGRSMIDALVAWDDAYTINGYLARAYDGVPQFIVDELPQVGEFTPVYNPEVLAQIENAHSLPNVFSQFLYVSSQGSQKWLNISQNPQTNAVLSVADFTAKFNKSISAVTDFINTNDAFGEVESGVYALDPFISSRAPAPQVADNVIATRLKTHVVMTPSTTAGVFNVHVIAGTEIVTRIQYNSSTIPSDMTDDAYISTDNALARRASYNLSACDWHPLVRITRKLNTGNVDVYFLGDIHNLTSISKSDLENLHKVCTYSELNAFMV